MKSYKSNRLRFLAVLSLMLGLTGSAYAAFYYITPPKALLPNLKSYSQSAADYQKWLFDNNLVPAADTTGASCKLAQPALGTWYLVENDETNLAVTRSCSIPFGRTLLIPVSSVAVCATPDDSPDHKTSEWIHGFAQSKLEELDVNSLSLTIDGVSVPNLASYYEDSALFGSTYPDGQLSYPCADAGYYVAVSNLLPGNHTIHWTANGDNLTRRNVTYNIKIGLLPF